MDIDTSSPISPTPPSNDKTASRKGRRAAAATKQDVDIQDHDTSGSAHNSKNDIFSDFGGGNSSVGGGATKTGWDVEASPRNSTGRRTKGNEDIDSTNKKTVIGRRGEDEDDNMIDTIPDIMDYGGEDGQQRGSDYEIATAPAVRAQNFIKSIDELENEVNQSSYTINQVQAVNIPGIDLSILIANALCPLEQLEQPDVKWDWDQVFAQAIAAEEANKA